MKRVADTDLRLLRIFATVVECKGFAVAQAELNLSASSISGYISALEQRLGVRLCTRGRAGFSLTDKGAAIYRDAQRLFAALDDFVASAGATRGRLTGTLKIGLVDCTVTDPNAPITRACRSNSSANAAGSSAERRMMSLSVLTSGIAGCRAAGSRDLRTPRPARTAAGAAFPPRR